MTSKCLAQRLAQRLVQQQRRAFGTLRSAYDQQVDDGLLQHCNDQVEVISQLQTLSDQLAAHRPHAIKDHDWFIDQSYPNQELVMASIDHLFDAPRAARTDSADMDNDRPPSSFKERFQQLWQPEPPEDKEPEQRPALTQAPRGLYVHGEVGCGKTMLLDSFVAQQDHDDVLRCHFHEFVQSVHRTLHIWSTTLSDEEKAKHHHNLIRALAKSIASRSRVLCFDEMQVTDVANFAILARLFGYLWEYGVVLVVTSNRPPSDLYTFVPGFDRPIFEQFVDSLKTQCTVVHVASETDFRHEKLQSHTTGDPTRYLCPINDVNRAIFEKQWLSAIGGDDTKVSPSTVPVANRRVEVPQQCNGVARFDFSSICSMELGTADYMAVSNSFHTIFLDGVPQVDLSLRNEARRLIWLVDACYEARCQLWVLSEVPLETMFNIDSSESKTVIAKRKSTSHFEQMEDLPLETFSDGSKADTVSPDVDLTTTHLFSGEEEIFAFRRCISRLKEMSCPSFHAASHTSQQDKRTLDQRPLLTESLVWQLPDGPERAPAANVFDIRKEMLARRQQPKLSEQHFSDTSHVKNDGLGKAMRKTARKFQ